MDSDKLSDELWNELMKNINVSRKGRGYVIDRVVQMEILLDQLICAFFTNDKDKNSKFYNRILNKEFFTLHQKIKVFSELELHKHEKFNGRFSGFTGLLHEANAIRNIVAHQEEDPYTPGFNVTIKNIKKKVQLNDDFLNEFESFMQEIYRSLFEIMYESGLTLMKDFGK